VKETLQFCAPGTLGDLMKQFILVTIFSLTFLNQAYAVDEPFALKSGLYVSNDFPGGHRGIMHDEGTPALNELYRTNDQISQLENRVAKKSQELKLGVGWMNDVDKIRLNTQVAMAKEELSDLKSYKLKTFGADADKLARELETKSDRAGLLWAEAQEKAELAEKYNRKLPAKPAAFAKLEEEISALSKTLFKEIKKDYIAQVKLAKKSKFRKMGRGKYGIAGAVIAAPLVYEAATGGSSAQANELKQADLPAADDAELKDRGDVEVGVLPAE
jgi:hypothetical protein